MNVQGKFPVAVTMTSREFNQHTGRAKAAADRGPVVITDRGRPTHVLITHDAYEQLRKGRFGSLRALEQTGGSEYDYEIELPERRVEPVRIGFDEE